MAPVSYATRDNLALAEERVHAPQPAPRPVEEEQRYQITTRSETVPSATALTRDLRRMMAEKARGHLIDRLVTP